jgi:hypothetical protein
MENKLTLHVSAFNDRVKAMNQLKNTELRMTSVDANNLLSDIFAVLAEVTRLQAKLSATDNEVVEVIMDGGGFK